MYNIYCTLTKNQHRFGERTSIKQALRPLRFLHSFQDNVLDCSQNMVELDDRTRLNKESNVRGGGL